MIFPLKINIEIKKRQSQDRLIVSLKCSAQSEWSNKPLFNIFCAINSHYLSCPGFDTKPLEIRLWRLTKDLNKAQRGVLNNTPSNSSSYLRIFFFCFCLSFHSSHRWYSRRAAVFIISHVVSCHTEVSDVDNQANHEAGGEQFLCTGNGASP